MPFTNDAFFDVFRSYNEHIWPAQLLLLAAGIAIVLAPRVRSWLLASLWVWCAIAYFWMEFTDINPAAWLFGALFLAGAFAFFDDNGAAEEVSAIRRAFGNAFIVYALVLYPAIGWMIGHRYPAMATFGAPCPLTIFTIGVLLRTRRRPIGVAIVPILWCAIGGSAAFLLGVAEDLALPLAGFSLIMFDITEVLHERHRMLHASS